MSQPTPSLDWMQLLMYLLQYIVSYLEGYHGVSTASQTPALPRATGVSTWRCRVQPLAASNQGVPAQLAPSQGPTPPQCSSTPLLAISVVMGTLSPGDAHAGGR